MKNIISKARISEAKALEIDGKEFQARSFFNPIQLEDGNYFISLVEAQYLSSEDFIVFDYVPPKIDENEN